MQCPTWPSVETEDVQSILPGPSRHVHKWTLHGMTADTCQPGTRFTSPKFQAGQRQWWLAVTPKCVGFGDIRVELDLCEPPVQPVHVGTTMDFTLKVGKTRAVKRTFKEGTHHVKLWAGPETHLKHKDIFPLPDDALTITVEVNVNAGVA
jgi:hypothetical protein